MEGHLYLEKQTSLGAKHNQTEKSSPQGLSPGRPFSEKGKKRFMNIVTWFTSPEICLNPFSFFLSFFFFFAGYTIIFNLRIIALQCCVSF